MAMLTDIQSYINKIKIVNVDGKFVPSLNSPQISWMLKWLNGISTVDVISRQIGSSTAQTIFASFKATTIGNQRILIRSHNMAASRMFLFNIRKVLESHGAEFKVKNNNQLKLINGTELTTLYDSEVKYDIVFLDQFGYSRNVLIPKHYSQIIIQSTATTDKNIFYDIVHNQFLLSRDILVSVNPWYVIPRSENWKENCIKSIGIERFNVEFMCLFDDNVEGV